MPRTTTWIRVPTSGGQNTQGYQGSERTFITIWKGQIGRFWSRGAAHEHQVTAEYFCRNTFLDGTGGHSTGWV